MPKSHDVKPRKRVRRLKAKQNSIIPALANYRSPRQIARARSRAITEVAWKAERALREWLHQNGLTWRHYERACRQAQAGKQRVAALLMEIARARNGGKTVEEARAA